MGDSGQTDIVLGVEQIKKLLPHRPPFLFVERLTDIVPFESAFGHKAVSVNEPYFQGHYPGNPVMPGVLQLESLAQAAGILMLRRGSSEGKTALLMSCDKVKFRRAVRPGDQVVISVKLTKSRGDKIACAEGTCSVGGQVVSSAELMFAIMDNADVES